MTLEFDPRTMFLTGGATSLLCAVMLASMRRLHPGSASGVSWGAAALACVGMSLLGIATRGRIPDFISYALTFSVGPIGTILLYESTRRMCGMRPLPWLAAGASASVFAVQTWLGDPPDHQTTRLLFSSAVQCLFCGLRMPVLVRQMRRDERNPMLWAIGLTMVFFCAHLARAVSVLIGNVTTTAEDLFAIGGEPAMVFVVFVMFTVAPMAFAMILMSWVQVRAGNELRRLATVDDLTGLSNRRDLYQRARRMLSSEALAGSSITGLMMIDVDYFKQVNDRHGHRVGDDVLAHVGRVLRRTLHDDDVLGRYGGEEFCAVLRRSGHDSLVRAAQAVREAVEATVFRAHEGAELYLTVSVGLATTDEHMQLEELVSTADRRLYQAKALGRNRVADIHTPAPDKTRRRDDLDLRAG